MRGRCAALVLPALLAASGVAAQPRVAAPPAVQAVAGAFELASADGARKCLVLLRPAAVPGGHGVGFPAPCKRTFPILASVAAWNAESAASAPRLRIRLMNGAGALLLDFRDRQDDSARAEDAAGATYLLTPTAGQTLEQRADSLAARPVPVQAGAARGVNAAGSDLAAMRKAAGAYALFRAGARDTGCRFELKDGADALVQVQEGCADKGVLVFGAQRWNLSAGTLWLTGAKGKLSFERNRKGGWDKGPGQGEALTLAPVER